MYDTFAELCKSNAVTPYKVSVSTGIPYTCLADWKSGRSTPKADKLMKIAKYFDVSVEYLLEENNEKL